MKKKNLLMFVLAVMAAGAVHAEEETVPFSAEEQAFAEKLDESQRYNFQMLTPEQRKAEMIASADEANNGDVGSLQEVH